MYQTNPVAFDPFSGPEISLIAPATEPQIEIWTSCLIGGDAANCAYNESFSLQLTGIFDKNAMLRALLDVVQLHESLRTTFSADGRSCCVYKELFLDIDYQDITSKNIESQQLFIKNYNQQAARTPFDLVHGPLFKTAVFKLSEHEHHLTFIVHHIVCDGWSIGIIMQDLSKLYSAYAKGESPQLPHPPLFSDYARSQLRLSASPEYKETENYWLKQFEGSNHLLNLPTDYPRPALRTYKSHRQDLILNGYVATELKKLGKSTASSFVTTLLAAFEVFLQQLTGQDEIIVGLPAAGQPATDNYRLVGHCVNLLALTSHPDGNKSFKTYLKQRRAAVLDAYEHQQYTFGSLLKKLNIARDASRVPLVPVMFNIDMGLDDQVNFYGLQHKLVSNPREYENFELFLNIAGKEESPTLEWSYNTQLFKASTISKMMDSFEFLLHELVKNPDTPIGLIPRINSAELVRQMAEWNNTQTIYPSDRPLHQLISEQAEKTPNKTAISFGSRKTTYRALNERANQLAAILIASDVKKGDIVAFALDRSDELPAAMLAIMKTGAVYLPIDPQFPIERINYMLEDAQAVLLLTSRKYKGCYSAKAKELLIEDCLESLSLHEAKNPEVEISSNDLVYVLYTSGSTGMPKGVQIAHSSLVNFLYSMQAQPGITADDKLLAVTTISFDIAGLELFLPLVSGAEIVIAGTDSAKDGRELLEIIAKEKITIMQATPYTWRMMLEAGWDKTTPLKVICGGEALPIELAQRMLDCAATLWNVYGPTETTIWSTVKQITTGDQNISVGRPIANTAVYILDNYLKPQAPGIEGEIYIGGDGVAKGYLNRPELSREKFVDDPFSKKSGAKMYRTGDMGRFMENGEIICLGRADAQVKIRGYRIETGEIEFQLARQTDIKEAVVIAKADESGLGKLLAFVVIDGPRQNKSDNERVQAWRSALKNALPDYMVPGSFIIVGQIPLTPNGKVDKKALANQTPLPAEQSRAFATPRTDEERLIADIWAEYLGIKEVGTYQNFFELGGHSLIAVQVMGRIEKETGKRLPLAALFENSTVEKLARLIQQDQKDIKWDSLVPIKPGGSKMPLYMVHGAGLNVLLFNTLAMNMSVDQPIFGLQAKGLNGVDEPLNRIEDIAAHYIAAILQQNPDGPYALAGYSFGGIIAFEMAKQLQLMGKEVKMLAMFDTYAYRSPHYDPWAVKFRKRLRFFKDKIWYNITQRDSFKDITIKHKIIRLYWKLRYGKNQNQEGLFGYSNKIDELNQFAEKHYQLKPFDVTVEVFRAENRTFYMDDFEFLGWKPYALKGVNIHKIPGEHNTIFKAPNDKIFARVLQKCLDQAVLDPKC